MFVAQLASFLAHHHHQHWADIIATVGPHRFHHFYMWAVHHGFKYQP